MKINVTANATVHKGQKVSERERETTSWLSYLSEMSL